MQILQSLENTFARIRISETVAALLPRGQPSELSPHVITSPPPHSTSSPLSLPVPRRGVTGQIGPIFKLLLFSRFFGIQLAAPHRAGRLGDVGRERSCIAFSQTLHGPRGIPRDWVSEQSALEHCLLSSFQAYCIQPFPSLIHKDRTSCIHRSRKVMMCTKPFESDNITFKEGVLSFWKRWE